MAQKMRLATTIGLSIGVAVRASDHHVLVPLQREPLPLGIFYISSLASPPLPYCLTLPLYLFAGSIKANGWLERELTLEIKGLAGTPLSSPHPP